MARVDDPRPRIAQLLAQGVNYDVIVARLSLEGWDPERVAVLLRAYVPTKSPPASHKALPAPRARLLLTGAVALVSVIAIGISSYTLYRGPAEYAVSLTAAVSAATTTPINYGAMPALSDPAYYQRIVGELAASGGRFLVADLSSMQLTGFDDAGQVFSVPILAKGKPGSWWETPVGIYKIESKEVNHYSSFGNVYMPWSLDFNGNFFIHGWPKYGDGSAVSTSYSGGCIRLADADAEHVYDFARLGIPVVVFDSVDTPDSFRYVMNGPHVAAAAYLAADVENGSVLISKNASTTLPIASLTKLVTALVVIEYFNLDREVLITPSMIATTSIARLQAGKRVSVHDLLILMLTESSNEAAESFARSYGRDQFIALMNKKARSIGLSHR